MSQELIDACDVILANKDHRNLKDCIKHAKECRLMCLAGYPPSEIKVQTALVLHNMWHWRGPDAKRVRAVIKAYDREEDT